MLPMVNDDLIARFSQLKSKGKVSVQKVDGKPAIVVTRYNQETGEVTEPQILLVKKADIQAFRQKLQAANASALDLISDIDALTP